MRELGRRFSTRGAMAALAAISAIGCLTASSAYAEPPDPEAYQHNDYSAGNAWNIVPPGQNGFESAADAAAFELNGTRPPHQFDQNNMYANLVYAVPGLEAADIPAYYKDASFGVASGEEEGIDNPDCAVIVPPSPSSEHCDDVTIQRDKFGVPHVYGQDRAALMF